MRMLTVRNPWAWLIMNGGKDVENRTLKTNYRGLLGIHASKMMSKDAVLTTARYLSGIKGASYLSGFMRDINLIPRTNGCILGNVILVDCVQNFRSDWAEEGMWHWVLKNPVVFDKPIPKKGALCFWEWDGMELLDKGD
jgi:hypothetical protein